MALMRLWQNLSLQVGIVVDLSLDAVHYVVKVRRLTLGDELIVFNGCGGEYLAQVVEAKLKKCSIKIIKYYDVDRESPCNIELVQAIPHGDKMNWVIQKSVELGVKKITPLITSRTHFTHCDCQQLKRKQDHWQAVAVSASEQSGRTYVPQVSCPISLFNWSANFTGQAVILSPLSRKKLFDCDKKFQESLSLIVGPEGGFSQDELHLLLGKDCQELNLGPRVLRTETAALVALSILQYLFNGL